MPVSSTATFMALPVRDEWIARVAFRPQVDNASSANVAMAPNRSSAATAIAFW
ncbi:MAG: hypothetical protein CAPSK01_000113 [Candidatus Accumulibacter vicinus]|uniref:Uncharacterized protein n=1 Tax=Candidatus Accumulibacter vicinus TaxID=2954382 RepID=A0A084Y5V6_9PROT|nr:MAG: hypothetical protein CAPSK01_000113 [Candidatus Accumulibacter vicinus]